jgi:hypothetical protein
MFEVAGGYVLESGRWWTRASIGSRAAVHPAERVGQKFFLWRQLSQLGFGPS